jgi:hypothetical protein
VQMSCNGSMAGTMRERCPGRWELRAFIGLDPASGKAGQIIQSYSAGRNSVLVSGRLRCGWLA